MNILYESFPFTSLSGRVSANETYFDCDAFACECLDSLVFLWDRSAASPADQRLLDLCFVTVFGGLSISIWNGRSDDSVFCLDLGPWTSISISIFACAWSLCHRADRALAYSRAYHRFLVV